MKQKYEGLMEKVYRRHSSGEKTIEELAYLYGMPKHYVKWLIEYYPGRVTRGEGIGSE